MKATIVHLNVTNFLASLAQAKDRSLVDKVFVVAQEKASRAVVLAASRRAQEEGIWAGMPLTTVRKRTSSLIIIPPDASLSMHAEERMTSIASRYTPLVEHDAGGHLYADLVGTSRLFGPPIDCAVRIRNELQREIGIEAATAVATSKLVAKVGTRTVRPSGIAWVREGEESDFLAVQDIALLPGVGPATIRLLTVAGIENIGQLAALADEQAFALLGKRGLVLRNAARGEDCHALTGHSDAKPTIRRRIDFAEPAFQASAIHAALVAAVEDAGLQMRQERLSCFAVHLAVYWADGVSTEAQKRSRQPLVTDSELVTMVCSLADKTTQRRVRIHSLSITLACLSPCQWQGDLFSPSLLCLQSSVDAIRMRFGVASLTHASALVHA